MRADLEVRGELSLVTGDIESRLIAEGSSLRWESDDAADVIAALPRSRSAVTTIARRLRDLGLRICLVDRRGAVVLAGDIAPSPLGLLLVGTSRVRPPAPRHWLRLYRSRRSSGRTPESS